MKSGTQYYLVDFISGQVIKVEGLYNEMTKLSNRVLQMEESVTLAAGARAKALKAQG